MYDFHESWHSEPRRGSARQVPAKRSQSAEPTSHNSNINSFSPQQIQRSRRPSNLGYGFDPLSLEALDAGRPQTPPSLNTRRPSAAYSYYGSLPPESRYTSFERPAAYASPHHNIDGGAVSNENFPSSLHLHPNTGSNMPIAGAPHAISAYTTAYSSLYGPYRPSPLPASPYTRTLPNQINPPPDLGFTRHAPRGFVDASTAASQGLLSPLEPMVEQYQRRMQATVDRRPEDTRATRPGISPYTLPHQNQSHAVAGQLTRAVHGSSENASVALPSQPNHTTRSGTVQAHRAAYERLQPANRTTPTAAARGTDSQPFRHSMPQTSIAYDRPSRPYGNTPHDSTSASQSYYRNGQRSRGRASAYHPRRPLPPQLFQPSLNADAPGFTPNSIYPQGSQPHNYQVPEIFPMSAYHPILGGTHIQPTRDSPLTALALDQGSGTTSRRSRSPLTRGATTARTHRRVPPEQRDQENDQDSLRMRRVQALVNARHARDEQQRTTMHETPPRTGPVERRMHD